MRAYEATDRRVAQRVKKVHRYTVRPVARIEVGNPAHHGHRHAYVFRHRPQLPFQDAGHLLQGSRTGVRDRFRRNHPEADHRELHHAQDEPDSTRGRSRRGAGRKRVQDSEAAFCGHGLPKRQPDGKKS